MAKKIRPIARPGEILLRTNSQTGSGKIMRRLLRDSADGRTLSDTTTLADPTVEEIERAVWGRVTDQGQA